MTRLRAAYGASPLHLLALLASFAIAGAAVIGWFQRPGDVGGVLKWFAAAIVIHDLVLLPLYSLLDRIAFGGLRERVDRARTTTAVRSVNRTPYVRIPAILSGLLLLVFFPVIFGLGAQAELNASGIAESGYLARWLLATGLMFTLSGFLYAAALARTRAPQQAATPEPQPAAPVDVSSEPAGPEPERAAAVEDSAESGVPEPEQAAPLDDAPNVAVPEPDQAISGDGATPATRPD